MSVNAENNLLSVWDHSMGRSYPVKLRELAHTGAVGVSPCWRLLKESNLFSHMRKVNTHLEVVAHSMLPVEIWYSIYTHLAGHVFTWNQSGGFPEGDQYGARLALMSNNAPIVPDLLNGHVQDLTEHGDVEPNPGPEEVQQVQTIMDADMGDSTVADEAQRVTLTPLAEESWTYWAVRYMIVFMLCAMGYMLRVTWYIARKIMPYTSRMACVSALVIGVTWGLLKTMSAGVDTTIHVWKAAWARYQVWRNPVPEIEPWTAAWVWEKFQQAKMSEKLVGWQDVAMILMATISAVLLVRMVYYGIKQCLRALVRARKLVYGSTKAELDAVVTKWALQRQGVGTNSVAFGQRFKDDWALAHESVRAVDANCDLCWHYAQKVCTKSGDNRVVKKPRVLFGEHNCPLLKDTYEAPELVMQYLRYITDPVVEGPTLEDMFTIASLKKKIDVVEGSVVSAARVHPVAHPKPHPKETGAKPAPKPAPPLLSEPVEGKASNRDKRTTFAVVLGTSDDLPVQEPQAMTYASGGSGGSRKPFDYGKYSDDYDGEDHMDATSSNADMVSSTKQGLANRMRTLRRDAMHGANIDAVVRAMAEAAFDYHDEDLTDQLFEDRGAMGGVRAYSETLLAHSLKYLEVLLTSLKGTPQHGEVERRMPALQEEFRRIWRLLFARFVRSTNASVEAPNTQAEFMMRQLLRETEGKRTLRKLLRTTEIEAPTQVMVFDDSSTIKVVPSEQAKTKVAALVAANEQKAAQRMADEAGSTLVESMVVGSKPVNVDHYAVVVVDDVTWANGIVYQVNNQVMLQTCRHAKDGMDLKEWVLNPDGFDIYTPYRNEPFRGKLSNKKKNAITHTSGDEVVYIISTLENLQLGNAPKMAEPMENVPIMMKYGQYDPETRTVSWACAPGTIIEWRHEKYIKYDISTTGGVCRAYTWSRDGKVVAGHWNGGDGGKWTAGSRAIIPPPNDPACRGVVVPWSRDWYRNPWDVREAIIQGPDDLTAIGTTNPRGACPARKLWPLRTDKGELGGIATAYHLMRPSHEMNYNEIKTFADEVENGAMHNLKGVYEVVKLFDHNVIRPAGEVTRERIIETVKRLTQGAYSRNTSEGKTHGEILNHAEYLARFECRMQSGEEWIADRVMAVYEAIERDTPDKEPDWVRREWLNMYVYDVAGKLDGYKQAKLGVGRTVQAPSFINKVLWYTVFGEADAAWAGRMARGEATWTYLGTDMDMPVSRRRLVRYQKARSCKAFDMSRFDRRIPAWLILLFFQYLADTHPGVSEKLLSVFAIGTIHTILRMGDGVLLQKHRGNPSGFMNTLRLNCFVSLYVLVANIMRLALEHGVKHEHPEEWQRWILENFHLEVCGDDTRIWTYTDVAKVIVDSPTFWEGWPWDVKIEGETVLDHSIPFDQRILEAPPMVARKLVPVILPDGKKYLFEPLFNVSRCLRSLVHERDRSAEEDEELIVAAVGSCSLLYYMVKTKQAISPAMEGWMKHFAFSDVEDMMLRRIGKLFQPVTDTVPCTEC